MIRLKSDKEIAILQKGGALLAQLLNEAAKATVVGASTQDVEDVLAALMAEHKIKPLFKGHQGYPAVSCISCNEEIVHGIPAASKIIQDGDIVGIDAGLWYEDLCVDGAITVPVGNIGSESKRLLEVTQEALRRGVAAAVVGNTVGDIGHAVQSYVEQEGMAIIRGLVGHGVGYSLWEQPQVPNYGESGTGHVLEHGLVIAIEPMVSLGSYDIETLSDGWTIVTADRSRAAQFEHSIAITNTGPVILTQL